MPEQMAPPPGLSVRECAALAHVHPSTIRRHIKAGSLPAYRFGSLIRVKPEDFQMLWAPLPLISKSNQSED